MYTVPKLTDYSAKAMDAAVRELLSALERHKAFLDGSDAGQLRSRKIASFRMLKTAEELLRERFRASSAGRVAELVQRLAERKITPYAAGEQLLGGVAKGT